MLGLTLSLFYHTKKREIVFAIFLNPIEFAFLKCLFFASFHFVPEPLKGVTGGSNVRRERRASFALGDDETK